MMSLKQHPDYALAKDICHKLHELGYTAWLAGGCVRDAILNRKAKDLDIATSAPPDEVENLFPSTLGIGKQFGVILVRQGQHEIEVASFRSDGAYVDGRHPESIKFSTPEEDASRRDFTINAMFWDIKTQTLHDFVGGERDLKARIIRTVGVAKDRFDEDKLRMIRAIRFVAELGFDLDPEIVADITRRPKDIKAVSAERIWEELKKVTAGQYFVRGLELLRDTGLLEFILPGVRLRDSGLQKLKALKSPSVLSVLSLIFIEGSDSLVIVEDDLRLLKVSNETRTQVRGMVQALRGLEGPMTIPSMKRLAAEPWASELVAAAHALGLKSDTVTTIESLCAKGYKLPAPLINGEHLKTLGLVQGAKLGELMRTAFEAQLSDEFDTAEQAIDWVKARL